MKHEFLLQLQSISVHYGGVRALDGVSLFVDEGEMVALMGPNGAGKSTVLKAIFGLAPCAHGDVLWHEKVIQPVPYEMVRRGVAFVPQGRRVFSHLTVLENLEIAGIVAGTRAELTRRIEEVFVIFPLLKHNKRARAGTLSGGGQQMLAIARGLMSDPRVLLLDEPSLGLAPKMVKEVFSLIQAINTRHRTALLIVEHNIKSLLEVVHRAYILDKGKVVGEDTSENILKTRILEKVFLGEVG